MGRVLRELLAHGPVSAAKTTGMGSTKAIRSDLCRTFACLAATGPTDACGSRRLKLAALESQGQRTHQRRCSQTHCHPLPCETRSSRTPDRIGIGTWRLDPPCGHIRWPYRRPETDVGSSPVPQKRCRFFAGRRGSGKRQRLAARPQRECAVVRRNRKPFGKTCRTSPGDFREA